jgi:hypothetical protein
MKIVPFLLRLFPRGFILAAIGRIQLRKLRKGYPPLPCIPSKLTEKSPSKPIRQVSSSSVVRQMSAKPGWNALD